MGTKYKKSDFLTIYLGCSKREITLAREVKGNLIDILAYRRANISSRTQVREVISQFCQQYQLRGINTNFSLPYSEDVFIKVIILPVIPYREVFHAAKWQLKDFLPFNLDTSICRWEILDKWADQDGVRKMRVMFALVKNTAVNECIDIASDCQLKLSGIFLSVLHYIQLMRSGISEENDKVILLDIEETHTLLSVFVRQTPVFIRDINFSLERFKKSMIGNFVVDGERRTISSADAEEFVEKYGVCMDSGDKYAAFVASLIKNPLDKLMRGIRQSLDFFYDSMEDKGDINVFYLAGEGIRINNLSRYIENTFNIATKKLELPVSVKIRCSSPQRVKFPYSFINIAGEILEHNEKFNFLSLTVQKSQYRILKNMLTRLSAIFFSLLFFIIYSLNNMEYKNYQENIKWAYRQKKLFMEFSLIESKINRYYETIDTIRSKFVPIDGFLKELSMCIPETVVFDHLNVNQQDNTVKIRGELISGKHESSVITFIRKLRKRGYLKKIDITSMGQKDTGTFSFELKGELVQ